MPDMTEAQRRDYAEQLMIEHAHDIEHLSIHEMAEQFSPTGECTYEDCIAVEDLIVRGHVTVTFEFPPDL